MKSKNRSWRFAMLAIAVFAVAGQSRAWGVNTIRVESKTVFAGSRGVEVGVYLNNNTPIAIMHLPFEIHEVTPGSYIRDTLALVASGRLIGTLYSASAQYFAAPGLGDSLMDCWWNRARPDFVSPDLAHYLNAAGLVNPAKCLPPGDDGLPPDGNPSLVLRFDVTDVPGTFEIDQSCVGYEHMVCANCLSSHDVFAPTFTKGVITIVPCGCNCHGDPDCNGVTNILDVVRIIGEAFGGSVPVVDSDCGRNTRSDINCDCMVDITDVVGMIDVAIRGGNSASIFCDGCSDNCP